MKPKITEIFTAGILFLSVQVYSNSRAVILASYQSDFERIQADLDKGYPLPVVPDEVVLDRQAMVWEGDQSPVGIQLRRTEALLTHLKTLAGAPNLDALQTELTDIQSRWTAMGPGAPADQQLSLYTELRDITRQASLANPLMNFDKLLFVTAGNKGGHMFAQYYGWNANNGGSIYIVENIKTTPVLVDVLENSTVQNGRLQGQKLAGGAFLSPDLSYDGQTILFAWRAPDGGSATNGNSPEDFDVNSSWHIFKVGVDGSNLVQLTDINENDFDPVWLPNGRIAFISTRAGGLGRCHNFYGKNFTLYSMKADGSDVTRLSYHETNEWHPSVDNDGMIVYARWDYVDRRAPVFHGLWLSYPDGRDPRNWHANYTDGPGPNSTFHIRSIPGSSKYITTTSGHHVGPYGNIILVDRYIEDDDAESQVKRVTHKMTYKENTATWDSYHRDHGSPQDYQTPWALSEDYYLVGYKRPNNEIRLIDRFGNEELIYSGSGIGTNNRLSDPIPVRARPVPPVIPTQTYQGERADDPNHHRAVISVMDVYNSDRPLTEGVEIKEMRVIQLLPKLLYWEDSMQTDWNEMMTAYDGVRFSQFPMMNYVNQTVGRMSLGTVPVEKDGSVYMEAPVGKALFFQLLDDRGRAVHSMRTATYVHPGEHLTCVGCHENKWDAPIVNPSPLAFQRPPSKLKLEYGTEYDPNSFYRLALPVLEAKCTSCHNGSQSPDMTYAGLQQWVAPKHARATRSVVGEQGALGSSFTNYIEGGHKGVTLNDEEYRRIVLWLDLNSQHYGAYYDLAEQRAGEQVWSRLDMDPSNPAGVEHDYPLYGGPLNARSPHGKNQAAVSDKSLISIEKRSGTLLLTTATHDEHNISIFDLSGTRIQTWQGRGIKNYLVGPGKLKSQLYVVVARVGEREISKIFYK